MESENLKDRMQIAIENAEYEEIKHSAIYRMDFEKASESCTQIAKEYAIEILKFISSEKTPYAIMYGNQEDRFADDHREYTPKQIVEIYDNLTNQ